LEGHKDDYDIGGEGTQLFQRVDQPYCLFKRRVVVTRNGKQMVAIVPIEDLELLEKIVDRLEDEIDAEEIKLALDELREGKTVPWEQVKKDLNL
jgi:PHD/YefM family antitoxin component YafN of YafNO toxin-antitoxin module